MWDWEGHARWWMCATSGRKTGLGGGEVRFQHHFRAFLRLANMIQHHSKSLKHMLSTAGPTISTSAATSACPAQPAPNSVRNGSYLWVEGKRTFPLPIPTGRWRSDPGARRLVGVPSSADSHAPAPPWSPDQGRRASQRRRARPAREEMDSQAGASLSY